MAINKTIKIDGQKVALKCSSATYILYLEEFNEDLFTAFAKYIDFVSDDSATELPPGSIKMLEQAAYIMARESEEKEEGNPEKEEKFIEWLDRFTIMGFINVLGEIGDLLIQDRDQVAEAKKKNDQTSAE